MTQCGEHACQDFAVARHTLTKTDLPTARLTPCSGVVNGNIHVIGGADLGVSTDLAERAARHSRRRVLEAVPLEPPLHEVPAENLPD